MADEDHHLTNFIFPLITTLLLGGIISGIYYLTDILWDRIKSKFFATLTLESSEPLYAWLVDYLIAKGLISQVMNNISVKTARSENTPGWVQQSQDISGDSEKPKLEFLPAIGYHSFVYKGAKVNFFHEEGKTMLVGSERKPSKLETMTLSCFGPWRLPILKSICEEAVEFAGAKDEGQTAIYALRRWWNDWEKVQSKKPRPFQSVILDSNIAEEIAKDIREFRENQKWYSQRGVPYRRGYMLYGPPGTGKTSFVMAVAAELNLSICTINLSGNELDDEQLNRALQNLPRNSIVLLEDIDAIFVERASVSESFERRVTFSGLLNALDGVRSQEGRILFMSTNHIEKLDPALLRPGRTDLLVKLDYATQDQIRRMFLRFFPGTKQELLDHFMSQVPENKLSMAKLQGHFLRNKNNVVKAVETAHLLAEGNEYTNEMSISHWLFRLNLQEFSPGFIKEKIRRVMDLKGISQGDLEKFGVKKEGDKKRIMNMIRGEESAKKAFNLMTHQSIRSFLGLFLKNQKEIETIVRLIPEEYITEYHMRDVFEKDANRNYEEKLEELLMKVKSFMSKEKKPLKSLKEPVKKYPKEKPIEILERLKMQEYIPKFIEHDLLEPEFFYKLDNGILKGELEIGNFGLRKLLMKEIDHFNKEGVPDEAFFEGGVAYEEMIVEKIQNALKKSSSIKY